MKASKYNVCSFLLPALLFGFSTVSHGSEIFHGSGDQTGGFQIVNPYGMLHFDTPDTGVIYQNTLDRSAYPSLPASQGGGYVGQGNRIKTLLTFS